LEIWLCVDDQVFSDEIKVMEQLVGDLREELSQELKVPVNIRLKEKGSFVYPAPPALIEDRRSIKG
jgi:phenylacetate-CoA ligase